jgi:hypothetical protein
MLACRALAIVGRIEFERAVIGSLADYLRTVDLERKCTARLRDGRGTYVAPEEWSHCRDQIRQLRNPRAGLPSDVPQRRGSRCECLASARQLISRKNRIGVIGIEDVEVRASLPPQILSVSEDGLGRLSLGSRLLLTAVLAIAARSSRGDGPAELLAASGPCAPADAAVDLRRRRAATLAHRRN